MIAQPITAAFSLPSFKVTKKRLHCSTLHYRQYPVISLVFYTPGKENFQTRKAIIFNKDYKFVVVLTKKNYSFISWCTMYKGDIFGVAYNNVLLEKSAVSFFLCYKLQQLLQVIDKGFSSQGFHWNLLLGFVLNSIRSISQLMHFQCVCLHYKWGMVLLSNQLFLHTFKNWIPFFTCFFAFAIFFIVNRPYRQTERSYSINWCCFIRMETVQ